MSERMSDEVFKQKWFGLEMYLGRVVNFTACEKEAKRARDAEARLEKDNAELVSKVIRLLEDRSGFKPLDKAVDEPVTPPVADQ